MGFQVWVIAHCTYVQHDFKIHLSVGLFLGLCLGSWRNHCRERWVRVSFSMAVFCNTGWGVGIRILGLALLKFFALVCGCPWDCPFKGLLPMCIHREHEGSVPSSPGSLLHAACRQDGHSVRQDLISCWHFDHCSYNNSGCWASCPVAFWVLSFFFFFLFLSLKGVRKIDLWNQLLKSQLCLEFLQYLLQDLS